jgi:hypothetical protein
MCMHACILVCMYTHTHTHTYTYTQAHDIHTFAVSELIECTSLSVLDISENKFDEEGLLQVLAQLPELAVLYANNNPICTKIVPVSTRMPAYLAMLS